METSGTSKQQNYLPLTYLSADSPASPSAWPANGLDSRTREALYFLNLPESSTIAEQVISASRMCSDWFLTTTETLSESSSKRLMSWGMTYNGKLLTARITSPKTDSEYLLSEILEDKPDPKYFLSEKTKERILSYLPLQKDMGTEQGVAISVTDRKKKVRVGVFRRFKVDGGWREMKSGISPTLTADGNDIPVLITEAMEIRNLTPVECERLQGFEDGHTALGSDGKTILDTQRYKTLGNAVTVPVIEDIFKNFFGSLAE